ncbi:MCP four helix bundle domain-containing protein [Quadrisphaera sp. INWT6]|uniref:MCP four helix bundle domain-containing protein n=1 Tax=Quadrisphaera sp. INWT6 TaxID=2596917 RepID=UPI0028152E7E|nr:MCP four helix bundle domain-containing protein [Quadrisphaera sp. INWT6]
MVSRLADLRISHKLFTGFSAVCLLLLLVAGVGITRLGQAQADLHELATSGLTSVDTADRTALALMLLRFDVANLALASSPDAAQTAATRLQDDDAALDAAWQAYLDSDPTSSEAERSAFTSGVAQYRAALDEMVPLALAGRTDEFVAVREADATPPPPPPSPRSSRSPRPSWTRRPPCRRRGSAPTGAPSRSCSPARRWRSPSPWPSAPSSRGRSPARWPGSSPS